MKRISSQKSMNSMATEIKRHALALLEMSKKFLLEDGDLDATAFIITAEGQLVRPIELQDERSKIDSCQKIVNEARSRNASVIITICLARSKEFQDQEPCADGYSWGDFQAEGAERCILVTISGPEVKNWTLTVPFKSTNGKITFQRAIEVNDGVDNGLFPGWSDQITSPRVS